MWKFNYLFNFLLIRISVINLFLHIYITIPIYTNAITEHFKNNTLLCSWKKIGYTEKKYLKFKHIWKYSIDICFEVNYMHATDLYLIIFSYLRNYKLPCLDLYIVATSNNKIRYLYRNSAHNLNKMTYREFELWWENRQYYDSQLLEHKEIYSIRLTFLPEALIYFTKKHNISLEDFYLSYKPAYPWSCDILTIFNFFIDFTNETAFWKKNTHLYRSETKFKKY